MHFKIFSSLNETGSFHIQNIFTVVYEKIWFLCLMAYLSSWVILCQSHSYKILVVLFNLWWVGDKGVQTFPKDISPKVSWLSLLGLQNTLTVSLQRGKTPSMSVLDMTRNYLMVRLQ